jgi:molybdopterin converting factor small subunit
MEQIQVKVEFTGVSRVLTGATETRLTLDKGSSVGCVIRQLGEQNPQLVGHIIEKDGATLIPTNVFSVNGQSILHESDLAFEPKDGDTLILLSLLAGG